MKEIISTITRKGQVTIPAEVRKHLGLNKQEKIAFVIDEEGDVHLKTPHYVSPSVVSRATQPLLVLRDHGGTIIHLAREVRQHARHLEQRLHEVEAERNAFTERRALTHDGSPRSRRSSDGSRRSVDNGTSDATQRIICSTIPTWLTNGCDW